MVRVLQFAGCINRFDFIDNIIQYIDPNRFTIGVAVGSKSCNIEEPQWSASIPRWVVSWKSRWEIVAAARRLAAILIEWRADILHTHHYDEAIIGWLATRLYRKTKLVVGRHYSDAIYRSTTGLKRMAMIMAEQTVNQGAARIIVPSSSIMTLLTDRQGVRSSKVDHVPYGFVAQKYTPYGSTARQELRRALGVDGRFVLGNFARLYIDKGQRYLIQAMAILRTRVPEASLLIVGEGPERRRLETQVQELGLGDLVQFLGWRRDAMALMSAVDVVVQPTLQEAFSQVMAEALWTARPLVITDVSGATDVVRHGETGMIVPREDPIALCEAIERLAGDLALRESLARAGRDYVRDNLGIEAVIPRYERAYLRAMGMVED